MKLVKPKVEVLDKLNGTQILKRIEKIARTCYKSEDKISEDDSSARKLVTNLINSKHEAMLEFVDITVKFTCSRSIAQEITRHRLASFAMESQRFCAYNKDKFGNEVTFVLPSWVNDNESTELFIQTLKNTELTYFELLNKGLKAQESREVLPNATKTELNMKCNLREWRHFFNLRCSQAAHPDIRMLALDLLKQFHEVIPIIFDDLYDKYVK